MSELLGFYLKRTLKNPVFMICTALLTILMLIGCYEDLGAASANVIPVFYCFQVTNSIGISHVLLPAVVVIPFFSFFIEEVEKGALYYQLIRGNKKCCYLGQIGAAALSSMMVTLLATVLFSVVCMLFGAGWQINDTLIQGFSDTYYKELIQDRSYLVFIIHVLAFVLYSMPWVLIGMVISLFTKNRYLILIGPFIIFMAWSYLTELAGLMILNPGYTLLKGTVRIWVGGGIFYTIGYYLVVCVTLALWYLIVSYRRFHHEGL